MEPHDMAETDAEIMVALGEDYPELRHAVRRICEKFPGEYWRDLDSRSGYPSEFVAALTEGQVARHVPGEADHSTWVNAAAAAAGGADGTFAMLPPTLVTLEEVSGETDVAAVLRRERSPRLLMPWLLRRPDGLSVRIDLDGVGGGEPGPASGIEDVT